MKGCFSCGRGFHTECKKCQRGKCHPSTSVSAQKVVQGVGRPLKNLEDQNDPESTGRKRAAILYPIFKDQPCEWKGLKNCGGGKHPITGCISGLQRHRHHGPIKDTRRNDPGNVHRICVTCHNRYHALTDKDYEESEALKLPHKPEPATEGELLAADAWWKTKGKRLMKQVNEQED